MTNNEILFEINGVVGETNVCTPKGCWVKVQVNGMTGYVNGAFLQKGTAPKNEEGIY